MAKRKSCGMPERPDTLGIVGFGNMGAAIAGGLVAAELYKPADIHVHDTVRSCQDRAKAAGFTVHETASDVADEAGTVIVAVKPKDVASALASLCSATKLPLIISIAAGVTTKTLEIAIPDIPVIRAMPNTPAMIRSGATVLARGLHATDHHMAQAKTILGAVGYTVELPEALMDAVTGLSGSGPAYAALLIEAMADGGVKMGLPRTEALRLAAETVRGTAGMILETGVHPAQLKDMVSSPGGTTIEGLAVLEKSAFKGAVISAVEAAARRSKELGK